MRGDAALKERTSMEGFAQNSGFLCSSPTSAGVDEGRGRAFDDLRELNTFQPLSSPDVFASKYLSQLSSPRSDRTFELSPTLASSQSGSVSSASSKVQLLCLQRSPLRSPLKVRHQEQVLKVKIFATAILNRKKINVHVPSGQAHS
jgi:hypothetical protein